MNLKDAIRQDVESVEDYNLRLARIATLSATLRELSLEAEQIRQVVLPLWYMFDERRHHVILLREDVDPKIIKYISDCYYSFGYFNGGIADKVLTKFAAQRVVIGNKVTLSKTYLLSDRIFTHFYNTVEQKAREVRDYLTSHLGAPFPRHPREMQELILHTQPIA